MFHQVVNIFHLLGVLVLPKSSKILLCVSLEVEPEPAPRLNSCFFTAPPLSLHSLSSLISKCLNLPFGTQGRSRKLKTIPYKQETGDTERLPCLEAAQGPAPFQKDLLQQVRKTLGILPKAVSPPDTKIGEVLS